MPSYGNIGHDMARWNRCLRAVAAQMLKDGWNKHARKFHTVRMRRSMKMYYSGSAA